MKIGRWSTFDSHGFVGGRNLQIGDYCKIEKDCKIGNNVLIDDYVKLMPGTIIGNNCHLDDYVNTSGYCEIGDNVRIKRCTMIAQACRIEDDVQIMSHVTTCRLKDASKEKEDWVTIKKGAVIGSHSCILAGVTIGEGAVIGAGAVVTKDCEPGKTYVGNPAKELIK